MIKNQLAVNLDHVALELHKEKKFGSELHVLQAISRIRHLTQRLERVCKWRIVMDQDDDHWKTECGNEFVWTDGGPVENGAKFCPYCGGKIEIRKK